MNTQPWEFTVLTGDILEKVKEANVEKLRAGEPPCPEHIVMGWPPDGIFRQRQIALAKQIFARMGIARDDTEKRSRWTERGFRFFDAPAAVIITVDRSFSECGPLLDCGAVMQNICLAALDYGLGTCIEDQGIKYPQVLRDIAGIPVSKRIIISIAIGYPDGDFPANSIETTREPIDTLITWVP
jgi:nitroreductase